MKYSTGVMPIMAEKIVPKVLVDTREPDQICDYLEGLGADIEIRQLELGDYQVSNRLVIERKTREDFEASVIDGRLFSQVSMLCEAVSRVVVIVEGTSLEPRISKKALLGAYSSLISDLGCSLFFTKSAASTAEMIYSLASHEQIAKKGPLSVYAKKKALTLSQKQRAVIEALPNVGPKLAKALLLRFKTVQKVISASEKRLVKVSKIGAKKAKQLRKVITSQFND